MIIFGGEYGVKTTKITPNILKYLMYDDANGVVLLAMKKTSLSFLRSFIFRVLTN